MNIKTSFILAIVFMILGSLYFFDSLVWKKNRTEEAREERRIFSFKNDRFSWVEIDFNGEKGTIRLECKEPKGCDYTNNQKWDIVRPKVLPAAGKNVASLLHSVRNLIFVERLEKKQVPQWEKEFGFDSFPISLRIQMTGSTTVEKLWLGEKNPLGRTRYVQASQKPEAIFLVPADIHATLNRTQFHWRNKEILHGIKRSDVTAISWKYGKQGIISGEKKNNTWQITQPQKVDADQELLNNLLRSIIAFRAKSEVPEDKNKKQGPPAIVISVTEKEKTKRIELYPIQGSKNYRVESTDLSWSAELEHSRLKNFSRTFPEYRERRIMQEGNEIMYARLSFISSNGRKKSHTLEKVNGNEWKEIAQNPSKNSPKNTSRFSSEKFQEFVNVFLEKNVASFIPSKSKLGKLWRNNWDIEVEFLDIEKEAIKNLQIRTDYRTISIVNGARKKELRKMNQKFTQAMPSSIVNFWDPDQEKVEKALRAINKATNKAANKAANKKNQTNKKY